MKELPARLLKWTALALAVAIPLFSPRSPPNFTDWNVYAEAGRKMSLGHTVYDVVGHYQYKYAPGVAALVAELSRWISLDRLGRANWLLELVVFIGLAFHLGLARIVASSSWKRYSLLLAFIAALAIPLRDELKLGQLNIWCWLLLAGAWSNAHRGRGNLAALFWTVAVSLKLYALIFAPYWIFKRRWKFLAVFAGCCIVLNIFGVAFFRGLGGALQENLAWVRSLTHSSVELVGNVFDVSIFGVIRKNAWPAWTGIGLWTLALTSYLGESWAAARRDSEVPRVACRLDPGAQRFFGRSLAWILLLNPLVWSYWVASFIFILIPSLEHPELFVGSIRIPRGLWFAVVAALVGLIHRHNTPLGLGGALSGAVGFLLLTRPRESIAPVSNV